MAIEIETKTRKKSNLVKYTLYVGVTLLLIMAVSYAFLYYSVQKSEQKLDSLKKQIGQQMSEQDKKMQQRITEAQKQLERSAQVIKSHRSAYNFFTTLESITHPQLMFNQMDLVAKTNKVKMKGITEDFSTLGQQVKAFQQQQTVEQVKVNSAQVEQGGRIGFDLLLTLHPDIFNFPPQ